MISVATAIAILLIGFSIFSAIVLAITHFSKERYQNQFLSRTAGFVLLLGLCGLQTAHFAWLYFDQVWILTGAYRVLLFTIAPAFFLFSYPIISNRGARFSGMSQAGHFAPLLISPLISSTWALPLAFIVGSGYLFWLAVSLYKLRQEREHFKLEMVLLGLVFAIAVAVSVLVFMQTVMPGKLFFSVYSISIGLAFLLVQVTLGIRPNLSVDITESVQAAYASSTLSNVDSDAALAKLDELMVVGKIFTNPDLGLASLAGQLGLSTHQTSELMNTRLGKSFSRYLREQRINAAKAMLCNEPSASVLSIGLNVGFTAQSNFYEAFREIEGMPPGQYRKLQLISAPR